MPIMVRQQVELTVDRFRLRTLDVPGGALVQDRPETEGQALVDDLLRHRMLENVRPSGLDIQVQKVCFEKARELSVDVFELSQLRIDAGQHGGGEHSADNTCHLQRSPGRFSDGVDAAEDQAVQAIGQLELFQLCVIPQIDSSALNEVDQFLDVQGVALRPVDDELHEVGWRFEICSENAEGRRANERCCLIGIEFAQRDLGKIRQ